MPGAADDVLIDAIVGTNQPTLNLAGGAVTIKSLAIGTTTNATLTFKNSLATDVNRRLRVTGNVAIGANGKLTHSLETAAGAGPETQQLYLDVGGNLAISGTIDVTGRGYDSGLGAAAINSYGASHGGQGGARWVRFATTYGSATNPVRSGSGYAKGPRGGGVVKLVRSSSLFDALTMLVTC